MLMILTAMHEPAVGAPSILRQLLPARALRHERDIAVLIEQVQRALVGIRRAMIDSRLSVTASRKRSGGEA